MAWLGVVLVLALVPLGHLWVRRLSELIGVVLVLMALLVAWLRTRM